MGAAEIRAARRQAVEAPLTPRSRLQAAADLDRLSVVVMAELHAQGVREEDISLAPLLMLKIEGADDVLPIPFGRASDMRAAFAKAHRRRFGVDPGDAPLVIAAISNEAVGPAEPGAQALPSTAGPAASDGDG